MRQRLQNRKAVILGLTLVVVTLGCCLLAVAGWTTGLFRSLDALRLRETATTQASLAVTEPFLLAIDHGAGEIEIIPGDESEIVVDVITRARTLADAEGVSAVLTREGDVVTLDLPGADRENLIVDLQIRTPRETALRLRQDAGRVEVEGLRGPLEIESNAGAVTVRDHEAIESFAIQIGTGSATLSLASLAEGTALTVSSAVGSVALTLPDEAGFELDAAVETGEIDIEDDFQFASLNREEEGTRRGVRGTVEPVEGRIVTVEVGIGELTLAER